jgi:hypothetical protein
MKIIRNIGLIFVVSMLIIASGGFSIYYHICQCAGERTESIFKQATCEHQTAKAVHSCCAVKATKSCCAGKPVSKHKQTCHRDKCCNTTAQFLKINDSYQPVSVKISLDPVVLAGVILIVDTQDDINSSSENNLHSTGLSPPASGREFLVAHHQLKLDTQLVQFSLFLCETLRFLCAT